MASNRKPVRIGLHRHRAPEISVIVPTRDRPSSLARCLAALERQSCHALEVIVVDDGSQAAADVRALTASSPQARIVRLEGAGTAAARNAGARIARAPLVLLTDDDCEPAPDWAGLLAARLRSGADVAAGRTENARPDDPFASASQAIASYLAERARRPDSSTVYSPGNNLACRAEVLRTVPFDERYPRTGGEDRDWCARVVAAGCRFVVEPRAVVAHRPDLTLSRFWWQQLHYGASASRFRRLAPTSPWLERPGFYLGLLRFGFRDGLATGLLVALAQVAAALGFLGDRVAWRGRADSDPAGR